MNNWMEITSVKKILTLPLTCKTIRIALFVASLQLSSENRDTHLRRRSGWTALLTQEPIGKNILMLEEQPRKPVTNDTDNSNNLWMEALERKFFKLVVGGKWKLIWGTLMKVSKGKL